MKKWLYLFIAVFVAAGCVCRTASPVLAMQVCISGRVPYEYVTESGYAGVSMEIFAEIHQRMGEEELCLSQVPWNRGLRSVEEGLCEVLLSGVWDEEREKRWSFPKQPIGSIAWQFFAREPGVALKGSWGGVRGFSYPSALYLQVEGLRRDVDAPTQESLVEKLINGRTDLVAIELGSAQILAKELGVTLYPVGKRIYVPLFAFFNKNVPQSVIDHFDEVTSRLWDEGFIARVYEKYGLIRPHLASRDILIMDEEYPPVTP
ncbi:transporter substrate-binding domain-containing protein [Desulfovibrio mangrovi]|uniref:substrate-binding periplasmic protein n=1 Tax=Desulfovibrio mangrovi TaxID=2976983 RepID=UPI002246DAA9|nr:transporter substrate-binding domain-containing protein [Desulfovibrio mangrovi]UZP67980.1 transporter substrate-binding domain-containing protein [Desulfovibrio mangrovi]